MARKLVRAKPIGPYDEGATAITNARRGGRSRDNYRRGFMAKVSGHDASGFASSLTGVSEHTRRAYTHDVDEFVAWCERGGCPVAADLDPRSLRRYFAYLQTRGFGKATISRKAASVHAYVRFLRRHGVVSRDVAARLRTAAARRSCRGSRVETMPFAMLDGVTADDPDDPRTTGRRAPRAPLRRGVPRERVLRSRRRGGRPAPRGGDGSRQGREGPAAAAGHAGVRRGCRVPAERTIRAPSGADGGALRQHRGHRLTPRDARRVLARYPLADGRTLHPHSLRHAATHLLEEGPICELSRSFSGTPMWVRRRSTLM